MINERILFILNPTAGGGRSKEMFERAKALLDAKKIDYSVMVSEYSGHAVKLTEEAIKEGESFIVAVGGDGTVNEISSVLCKKNDIKFGILPFGTGNDIAGTLNIPSDIESAIDVLLNGSEHPLDMGVATELWGERRDRYFINVAGQGFDADVLMNTDKHKKHSGGMMTYILGIIDSIFNKKKLHVRIICDKIKEDMDIIIAIIANGRSFGGGMIAAPLAETDDNLFDVCLIEDVSFIKFILLLPLFMKGKHLKYKEVRYFKTDKIRIESSEHYNVELDGEILLKTSVEYRIIPNAIQVIR